MKRNADKNVWPTPEAARKLIDRFHNSDETLVYLNKITKIYQNTDFLYMKRMCILMGSETVLKYRENRLNSLIPVLIKQLCSYENTYVETLKTLLLE